MSRLAVAAGRLREFSFLKSPATEPVRASERLGQPSRARPEGCVLWLHARAAADAGPVLTLAKDLSRLRQEPVNCLVTTDEDSPLVPALDASAIHQLAPGETAGSIARFLDHWRPDIGIEMGVTDRPRLYEAAAGRKIPLFHVLPSREAAGGRRKYPGYLAGFRACLAVSASEAQVLRRQLEARKVMVEITGPLCDTVNAPVCNEAECDALARLLGGRPVWLASGAVAEEIGMIEKAHRRAFRSAHRMLLILVPADVKAAPAIAEQFSREGWRVALRSEGAEPDPEVQVYVADTEDEQGLWYRLSPTSYIGGTLTPGGPKADPFDPAALGSAVLTGPQTGAAPARFERLAAAGALITVASGEALGEAIQTLLAPDKAASLAQAGWAVTTQSAHVVERLAELIDLALDGEALV